MVCLALAAAEAPVEFRHGQHAALKLKCVFCHEKAGTGERAGFPAVARCMTCHVEARKEAESIRALAALGGEARPFGTRPRYRVPDFVFFSHARHRQAGQECAVCHGPAGQLDVKELYYPTTMKGCVDCHKVRGAPVACNLCHELNQ